MAGFWPGLEDCEGGGTQDRDEDQASGAVRGLGQGPAHKARAPAEDGANHSRRGANYTGGCTKDAT